MRVLVVFVVFAVVVVVDHDHFGSVNTDLGTGSSALEFDTAVPFRD